MEIYQFALQQKEKRIKTLKKIHDKPEIWLEETIGSFLEVKVGEHIDKINEAKYAGTLVDDAKKKPFSKALCNELLKKEKDPYRKDPLANSSAKDDTPKSKTPTPIWDRYVKKLTRKELIKKVEAGMDGIP